MGQSLKEAKMAMLLVEPVLLVTDETFFSWCIGVQNIDIPSLKWRVLMEFTSTEFANEHNQFLKTEMLKQHEVMPSLSTYAWAPDDAVVICFTSGTTGRPKGVTISHLAFITQSLAKIAIVGYGEDDVYLHTSPLVHIGGLSSAMAMLIVGACHVLLPKFDAETAIQVMEQHCVTCFITVPAMMADLVCVNRTMKNGAQNSCVRKILNGGGSLSSQLLKDAAQIFPRAKILSAYGMTEACSSLTFMTLHDPTQESCKVTFPTNNRSKQGTCVGKPAPHIELMVKLDENSLRVGKILTRGPHTMLGYWGHQENVARSESSSNGDWLDTGDIGTIDEFGNLWLIGRSNGRIKTGGENVYPEEVEAVLLEHPGIVSAVVIGIVDVRLGEMVVACVRLQESWVWSDVGNCNRDFELSSEALKHHCRTKNITGFKIPKRFVRWEKQFPLTTTGKVKRDEVRREVMSHFQILTSSL
ncbi:2-succinylbenzoate--CoA ligase, chloroplastic/peroxisomal isoform X2 [Eutrema salsugineum]|uniref:2-succinylbenzoate--CoA ligase, chloroplastic/peroxisomal isoform X2 n=1 Tax=Eutrema salsugineum TaxID=72664 RepID=UPI000CECE76D|nr:2-succinylbenzoate--CoA ligase, chloroplastic/peroxisomal isoform X2 [Eutrema salsugineum]